MPAVHEPVRIEDLYRVCDPHAQCPGEAPGRFFQNQYCHLFHLFYQVQIRLGSPNRLKNREHSATIPIMAQ